MSKDYTVISTVLVIQMPLYASLVSHVNCNCHQYSPTDWSLFHKLCKTKIQNLPYWYCNTDFVTRLVGEASSTSTNPNIFLVRLCCSQHETDEKVIPSRQTNLFVVNQPHRHIWLLSLSCLLATNFTVIFGCLVCLVCYQPISPNYHHCFQKR